MAGFTSISGHNVAAVFLTDAWVIRQGQRHRGSAPVAGIWRHGVGVRNLHAKMYLFGSKRAIVTSANLTEAALNRNHEFGLISEETEIVAACRRYFDNLWMRSGADLTISQADQWDETVTRHRAEGGRPNRPIGLGDFGVDAGMVNPPPDRPAHRRCGCAAGVRGVPRRRRQSGSAVVFDQMKSSEPAAIGLLPIRPRSAREGSRTMR